ncbi:uncharacterized protein V1516DRAFT_668569 [Lipomyces oligophaga]|uniref:uncharacterized protein n=1 Tax=Lipomyces oligophaga TaxID=45792 RepID=UPI0034CFA7D8
MKEDRPFSNPSSRAGSAAVQAASSLAIRPAGSTSNNSGQTPNSSSTSGRRRRRTTGRRGGALGTQIPGAVLPDRDPDYDRSLPVLIPAAASSASANAASESSSIQSQVDVTASSLSQLSVDLNQAPRSKQKQLYDPRTDSIAATSLSLKEALNSRRGIKEQPVNPRYAHPLNSGEDLAVTAIHDTAQSKSFRTSAEHGTDGDLFPGFANETDNSPASPQIHQNDGTTGDPRTLNPRRRRRGHRTRDNIAGGLINEEKHRSLSTTIPDFSMSTSRQSGRVMVLKNPSNLSSSPVRSLPPKSGLDYPHLSVDEIKSLISLLYTRILYLEHVCIDIFLAQSHCATEITSSHFSQRSWSAIVRLYEELIEEYDDFIFACSIANATSSIRALPQTHKIPIRIWKIGVRLLIEILRVYLPQSNEVLCNFVDYVYVLVGRLYECNPVSRLTWMELLGDLARCRMVLEREDSHSRQCWQEQSFMWYTRCSLVTPGIGRIYHHLSFTSENAILDQLYYQCKSLSSWEKYASSRDSVVPLFDLAFDLFERNQQKVDLMFVQLHAMLFTLGKAKNFSINLASFLRSVNKPRAWVADGIKYAIVNVASLFQLGLKCNALHQLTFYDKVSKDEFLLFRPNIKENIDKELHDFDEDPLASFSDLEDEISAINLGSLSVDITTKSSSGERNSPPPYSEKVPILTLEEYMDSDAFKLSLITIGKAKDLSYSMLSMALTVATPDHYSHIFAWLVFLDYIKDYVHVWKLLLVSSEHDHVIFPWSELMHFLTTLTYLADTDSLYEAQSYPSPSPLKDDWAIYGLIWSKEYPYNLPPRPPNVIYELETSVDSSNPTINLSQQYFPSVVDTNAIHQAFIQGEVGPLISPDLKDRDKRSSIRVDRILWLAFRLTRETSWFEYIPASKKFCLSDDLKVLLSETI